MDWLEIKLMGYTPNINQQYWSFKSLLWEMMHIAYGVG